MGLGGVNGGLEVGLELFRKNADEARRLLPPDMALRTCKSWGDVGASKSVYRVAGIDDKQIVALESAIKDRYQWRQWAFAVICAHLTDNGVTSLRDGWLAGEEPPECDGHELCAADKEWVGNLGRIVPVEVQV